MTRSIPVRTSCCISFAFSFVALAGCGSGSVLGSGGVVDGGGATGGSTGSGGNGSGGNGSGKVPLQHRSTSASCPSQRGPRPSCVTTSCASTCSSDSQCIDGVNGRCFPWEGLVGPGGCSYDECFSDSNCGARTPCLCRSSSTDNSANMCDVGGNCAVDSDCGPGGYCSPSVQIVPNQPPNVCWGSAPYYCHRRTKSTDLLGASSNSVPRRGSRLRAWIPGRR